jgi:hypothetical protein
LTATLAAIAGIEVTVLGAFRNMHVVRVVRQREPVS